MRSCLKDGNEGGQNAEGLPADGNQTAFWGDGIILKSDYGNACTVL